MMLLKNHRYKSTTYLELFPLKFIFHFFSIFCVKVKLAVKRSFVSYMFNSGYYSSFSNHLCDIAV